jgi:FKBP-type peptidyl-prolyl cis-trans isomerase
MMITSLLLPSALLLGAHPPKTPKLFIKDLKVGKGAKAKTGDTVTVDYTGTLTNGKKFDSSLNPGRTPFVFPLGAGQVIKGWDQGVVGMRVGGTRKLIIPPALAYGSRSMGPDLPANSTLVFVITLHKISH